MLSAMIMFNLKRTLETRLEEVYMTLNHPPRLKELIECFVLYTVGSCLLCSLPRPLLFSSSLGEELPGSSAVHLQQAALRSTFRGFSLAEEFQNYK